MQTIDLSASLSNETPVFPGDSRPVFSQVFNIEQHGWNMTRFTLNTHDATHVNAPIHSKKGGKTLDDYTLDDFMGEAITFEKLEDIQTGIGIIFGKENISQDIAKVIVKVRPKFVGLSSSFEFDLEVEKYLLENDIISFERLENTHLLPKKYMFYGIPLKIKDGDGSPVRAFAQF